MNYLKFIPLVFFICISCSKRPSFLLNDFEGETFGNWQATGNAFGPGPSGTLPLQPGIKGLRGKGAANSFHDGAIAVGTLTSTQFKIERRYINFLIGGGASPDSLGIQLSVEEQVIYKSTATSLDSLEWQAWDLKDYLGKSAQIVIFDFASGSTGYIVVDHILQSDVSALKVKPD